MSTHVPILHSLETINTDIRIALVVGEFNRHQTERLEAANRDFLTEKGFSDVSSFLVPGAFEIPGMVSRLLETDEYDLIIALGVVVRGDTPHFDYICTESARGLMDLTLAYDTPIINGILTCNTDAQVEERIGSGYALSGLNLLAEVAKI
jgi:6,7-dimethyl-8-ribityllumazine synthase